MRKLSYCRPLSEIYAIIKQDVCEHNHKHFILMKGFNINRRIKRCTHQYFFIKNISE